jgi:hypothetical protein
MKYSTNYNINVCKKYQFAGAGKIPANRYDGVTSQLVLSRALISAMVMRVQHNLFQTCRYRPGTG